VFIRTCTLMKLPSPLARAWAYVIISMFAVSVRMVSNTQKPVSEVRTFNALTMNRIVARDIGIV
jgi:hypothetical protein